MARETLEKTTDKKRTAEGLIGLAVSSQRFLLLVRPPLSPKEYQNLPRRDMGLTEIDQKQLRDGTQVLRYYPSNFGWTAEDRQSDFEAYGHEMAASLGNRALQSEVKDLEAA